MQYADPTKLRAYFFGNMYISPIQQGIQAAHVVTKLFQKYGRDHESESADALYDWADVGVTKILLNGGYQSNLADVYFLFEILGPEFDLPFAKFHEEEASLNGALTSIGIVVPEEIYAKVDAHNWLNPEMGVFARMPIPAKNPTKPTPQEILAFYPLIKKGGDDKLRRDLLATLLFATLKTSGLA